MADRIVFLQHKIEDFHQCFQLIKDIFEDVHLLFDMDGLHINGVDDDKIAICSIIFRNLNVYEWSGPVTIHCKSYQIARLLKGSISSDEITMHISTSKPNELNITIGNETINTKAALTSLDIKDYTSINLPTTIYSAAVLLKAKMFQQHIKEVGLLSKQVFIEYNDNNQLIVSGHDEERGNIRTVIKEGQEGLTWLLPPTLANYRAKYPVKYLERLLRADKGKLVSLHFGQEAPIMLKYTFGVFTEAQFFIADQ